IGRPELGVSRNCRGKLLACFDAVVLRVAVEMNHSALICASCIDAVAVLHPRSFALGTAQLRLDTADDCLRDVILDGKYVGQRAIVASGPDAAAIAAVHELGWESSTTAA